MQKHMRLVEEGSHLKVLEKVNNALHNIAFLRKELCAMLTEYLNVPRLSINYHPLKVGFPNDNKEMISFLLLSIVRLKEAFSGSLTFGN